MGYNTTIVVMNDALDSIEKDPEFGYKLATAVRRKFTTETPLTNAAIDVSANNYVNAAMVIETHHADSVHLVTIGANYGQDLGYIGGWRSGINPSTLDGKKELLRRLADNLGLAVAIRAR